MFTILLLVLFLSQNSFCLLSEIIKTPEDHPNHELDEQSVDPKVLEDAYLTTPQLLVKYGHPVEIHEVQTSDGYLLEMHRIPNPCGIPVFLQHGLVESSGGWIVMGPHSGLGYYLADLGYDVWMGNARGNRYSRKHIYLSPKSKEFWDFSFHEIGIYDLPAMVDYVLETTGFTKLHYVGHSQGTTAFWIMCSERPGYCDKILSMQALAPVAYLKNAKSPLVIAIAPFSDQLHLVFNILGMHEFLPNTELMKLAGQALCRKEAITQPVCSNIMFLVEGYNSDQLNRTMLPVILGHFPAGAATKQVVHYGQLYKSGQFRMFDYGLLKNKEKYGTIRPPSYDLSKITAPVALHYSRNDWLADPKDVTKLRDSLPNVINDHLVSDPKFNHLDFLFAINSRHVLQTEVVKSMKLVEEENPHALIL